MKLLIYNWVQFDNSDLLGGGVSIYLKRLIPELLARDIQVIFLSVARDQTNKVHIQPSENDHQSLGVKTFQMFNCGVPFPHREAFGMDVSNGSEVLKVLGEFIKKINPNVINFQGIEGLPPAVLRMRTSFPKIQWWFTAHNYHLACQQLQLFNNRRNAPCDDYLGGSACRTCLWQDLDNVSLKNMLVHRLPRLRKVLPLAEKLTTMIKSKKHSTASRAFTQEEVDQRWLERDLPQTADYFRAWREDNAESVAKYLDGVVVVSELQKKKLIERGFDSDKLHIQSPAVSNDEIYSSISKPTVPANISTIAYWGYSNPGTGLSLFIESLERVAHQYKDAKRLSIVIVSDTGKRYKDRLAMLSERFARLTLIKRYDSSEMPEIASSIDLAVLAPVMPETYCQVAAELYFMGVPIIGSSNLGFAKQHIRNDKFIFESGNDHDLSKRIIKLLDNPSGLDDYWATTLTPPSIEEHARGLIKLFAAEDPLKPHTERQP